MKVTAIEIENIRWFKTLEKTELSKKINVFIGPNNAGKSTILSCISLLQNNNFLSPWNIRFASVNGIAKIYFEGDHKLGNINRDGPPYNFYIGWEFLFNSSGRFYIDINGNASWADFPGIPEDEVWALIYPFSSKRKVALLSEEISEPRQRSIKPTLEDLNPKLDRISDSLDTNHDEFTICCRNILE